MSGGRRAVSSLEDAVAGAAAVVSAILRELVRRPIGETIDDRELAVEILLVQRAFTEYLRREGMGGDRIDALCEEMLDVGRVAYTELWLKHAREDGPYPVDEAAERAAANEEFESMLRVAVRA